MLKKQGTCGMKMVILPAGITTLKAAIDVVVLVTEGLKPGFRGELTRWLLEAKSGVFIGNVSATIRDILWDKVIEQSEGSSVLIYSSDTEQGFSMRMSGTPARSVVDIEGILLIKTTLEPRET